MDSKEFIEGEGYVYATDATNMLNSPNAHLAPHNNGDLNGGILLNGLPTLVQADKKSNKLIVGCWALPVTTCIAHVVDTHSNALKEDGNNGIALIMLLSG